MRKGIIIYHNGNNIKYDDISFRKFKPASLKLDKDKIVYALDTETYKGDAKLICDSDGAYLLDGNMDARMNFMTQFKFRNKHNFFYNLKFDIQAILKPLGRELLLELYRDTVTWYGKYKLKYIPKKSFTITTSGHTYAFYDIAQFYERKLETASQEYLGEGKITEGIDAQLMNTNLKYWNDNQEKIIEYCKKDALLTKRLGDYLQATYRERLDMLPRKYVSKASVAKDYFKSRCNIPDIRNVPKSALALALAAYSGGRFEVLERGAVGYAESEDICSCYPFQITLIPDITRGEWRRAREPNHDALLGYYHVVVNVPPMRIAPLPFRVSPTLLVFPCGQFSTYMTLSEIKAYEKYIDIKVIRGIEYFDKEPVYPFRDEIYKLYELKRNTPKNHFGYDLVKKMLNSLYGAFYEKYKNGNKMYAGPLFNPINATEITAGGRIELFREGMIQPKNVIAFATDGIIRKKRPEHNYNNNLGSWDKDADGDTVIFRSGVYRIGERTKNRGIARVEKLVTPYGKYESLFDYLEAQPRLSKYPIINNRPLGLGECLLHTQKKSLADLNIFRDMPYELDINRDSKRVWFDTFQDGGDLMNRSIQSLPIILGDKQ